MSSDLRDKISFRLWHKAFQTSKTFENARIVFLVCRKYSLNIPDDVLEVITSRFEKDNNEYQDKQRSKSDRLAEERKYKQVLLFFALSCETLELAYQKYTAETGISATNDSLRKKLERFLDEEQPEVRHNKLCDKIKHYREHLISSV